MRRARNAERKSPPFHGPECRGYTPRVRPRDLLALEFPRVCARLADFAASSAGQDRCRALTPVSDHRAADAALERAWQCFRLLEQYGDPPLQAFADVRPHLRSAAHEGFALDGKTLVAVRQTLETIRTAGADLRRALDDDGIVLDQASDALARVRAAIRRLRDTLTRKLEDLIARRGMADIIADSYVTLRNSRFVIPVRVSAAAQLQGVVQDRSVSGETLFVEPLFAVELNNELLLAVREEEAIVQRILADLTNLLGAEQAAIAA